jgi:hypothetical protein
MNTFNEFDILSNKICSNLKILSIICSKNIIFLDASQWERLILQYYPQLEKFYFVYHERLDNNNQYQLYSKQTNSFSSSFWIERKWIFDVKINNTEIKYLVYPYRYIIKLFLQNKDNFYFSSSKRWYDNIDNYSVEPFTFTNLTVECILDMIFDVVQKQIEHVLRITEIYHLEILEKHFRMSLLIQVVNLLSNITTLKLHSLPTIETITITFDEFSLLLSMKAASKITKVYLEEIGDIQELDFIFMLCPYIEYFKVGRINMIDIKAFLRVIFNKMNHYQIYYLRSLCFHVQTSDDRIVENIEEMIKYEKIFHHFTIKRILDTVYLQWK